MRSEPYTDHAFGFIRANLMGGETYDASDEGDPPNLCPACGRGLRMEPWREVRGFWDWRFCCDDHPDYAGCGWIEPTEIEHVAQRFEDVEEDEGS